MSWVGGGGNTTHGEVVLVITSIANFTVSLQLRTRIFMSRPAWLQHGRNKARFIILPSDKVPSHLAYTANT